MLIHGARAALPALSRGETPLGGWLRGLLARAHVNTAVVALAAKLARIIRAVLRSGRGFETRAAAVSWRTGSVARAHPARAADEVCGRRKRDGLTVDRRSGILLQEVALDAVVVMRTGARGSPSWPGPGL